MIMTKLRFLMVAAALLCACLLDAQTYTVLSKKGECFVLQDSKWQPLQIGALLSPASILRSYGEPAAEVQILDEETSACYRVFLLKKDFRIGQFLNGNATESAPGKLEEYSVFMKDMITVSRGLETKIIRQSGAATQRKVELLENTGHLVWSLVSSDDKEFRISELNTYESDYGISVLKHGDGVRVLNLSDVLLYVNVFVLRQEGDGDWELDILHSADVSLSMEPSSYRDFSVSQYGDGEASVLIIASKLLIDPADVRGEIKNLDGMDVPTDVGDLPEVGIAVLNL